MQIVSENSTCRPKYDYDTITFRCANSIRLLMEEAREYTTHEARYCEERAYGVYVGWKALVAQDGEAYQVCCDEKRLQNLLTNGHLP